MQRDVRQLLDVGDLQASATFLRLSVLETSFLVFRLSAWHRNPGKRLVKAPKLHWVDSGLVCHLLGIRDVEQLRLHPLRGAIFESWVASEIYKAHLHRGVAADLHHLRQTCIRCSCTAARRATCVVA